MKKLREKFYRYGYDPELGIVVDTSPDDIGEIAALAQYRAEDQGDCDIEALGIEMTTQDTIDRLNQQNTRIACLTARQAELEAKIERAKACGACADFVLDEEGE